MLRYMLLTLFFVFAQCVSATAQEPDRITISGVELPLTTNPLDEYIEMKGWEPPEEASIWSSNWRGYIATWKIEGGYLMLSDASILLEGYPISEPKRKSIIPELFDKDVPQIAVWYSGALIVPNGTMTNYVHMGYGSEYEHYEVLRIDEGLVIEHLSLTAEQFSAYRHRKFQRFMETEIYKNQYDEMVNGKDKWTEEDATYFMKSYYAEYYLSL